MTIQAIETRYKGYKFRSRLEARWAVFFDSLGLKWDYEPEGFDLGSEGWYLPDFYIHDWNAYCEIKPRATEAVHWKKPPALAIQCNKFIFLIEGSPWVGEYEVTFFEPDAGQSGPWVFGEFAECRGCSKYTLLCGGEEPYADLPLGKHECNEERWSVGGGTRIVQACTAARSARFEHS